MTTIGVASIRKNLDQWDVSGSSWMQSNCPGAYFTLRAGNTTSFTLMHDQSRLSGFASDQYPKFRYSIDGGVENWLQLTSSGADVVASGLSNGPHTLAMRLDALPYGADLWADPEIPRITGIDVDSGATAMDPPATKSKNVLWIGDSHAAGYRAAGNSSPNVVSDNDAGVLMPYISRVLNADYCVMGWASVGYVTASALTGVPALTTAYQYHSAGRPRLSSGTYQHRYRDVVLMMGINDPSLTATQVETGISNQRTAAGAAALIHVCVPWPGTRRAAITAGVAQYISNNPSDGLVYLVDMGATAETGLSGGLLTTESWDGSHPKTTRLPALAALVSNLIEPIPLSEESTAVLRRRGFHITHR